MLLVNKASYDSFAWFYNKHWGQFNLRIISVINDLMLEKLPRNPKILDLCCGSGQLSKRLVKKGCEVTGVDISAEMISLAKENAPTATFLVSDIRTIEIDDKFHGVVSIFDSLNHLLELADLEIVFKKVHEYLETDGIFLFDMLLEEGFQSRWTGSNSKVSDEYVYVDNSCYDPETKIGTHNFTVFYLTEIWHRVDASVREKCYSVHEVIGALERAGFSNIVHYDMHKDLHISGQNGRVVFTCNKL